MVRSCRCLFSLMTAHAPGCMSAVKGLDGGKDRVRVRVRIRIRVRA